MTRPDLVACKDTKTGQTGSAQLCILQIKISLYPVQRGLGEGILDLHFDVIKLFLVRIIMVKKICFKFTTFDLFTFLGRSI